MTGADHNGQATVELVALLPLLLITALAAAALIAAQAAGEQAGQAAEAGAVALLGKETPPGTIASQLLAAAEGRVGWSVE
jgi:hypothetical protein